VLSRFPGHDEGLAPKRLARTERGNLTFGGFAEADRHETHRRRHPPIASQDADRLPDLVTVQRVKRMARLTRAGRTDRVLRCHPHSSTTPDLSAAGR
jgi:hypothetical protein